MKNRFSYHPHLSFVRRWVSVLSVATLTACGGGSAGGTIGNSVGTNTGAPLRQFSEESVDGQCSVAEINQWIDERMRDDYIYYDQVPVLDLAAYDDPALLIRDLRVEPDIYSSVVDQVQNVNLIDNSNVTRFGFRVTIASDDTHHFADISGNSPMQNAGIERGDRLIAVNGVPYADLTPDQFAEFILDEPGENLTTVFTVQKGEATPQDIEVTKQSYIEETVPVFGTYAQTDDSVGYMKVDSFRGTTTDEINTALETLAGANVSELILDLRYNGGGFTRTARKLASQIVGDSFVGQVYSRREFNDKYSQFNLDLLIEEDEIALDLPRLFVLTTLATASASETLINGLNPLIDVVVIGELTTGKPFTSVAQDFCGLRLNAMSTITTNGISESVLGGVVPTCTVSDDFLVPTDNLDDPLTSAAFYYMENSSCPGTSPAPLAKAPAGQSVVEL